MKMTGLWNDGRFALRGLFRAPGFTIITIGTLALGIGATTAIFSVVNGVLLKPLPFEDADELVAVGNRIQALGLSLALSPGQEFTYRNENRVFEDIGSWNSVPVAVTGIEEPQQLSAMWVTAGLFPLLRVQPVIGRRFTEEDDSPGAPQTIMLSHAYWQLRFGADAAVVGSTLRVDGTQREIIGVLPSEFVLPRQEAAIYLPSQWDPADYTGLDAYSRQTIGRLLPGVTIERASADVARMRPIWVEQFPSFANRTIYDPNLRPLKQDFVGDIGNVLWVLLGTVGIVLLIACANVANLFLVRAEGRLQEVAVRCAIGASRGQIARKFLVESLVLGLLGGLVGLSLAFGGVRLLAWMGPATLPRLNEISLDRTVLAFTLGISILAGPLFGLFPVFRVGGLDLVSSLKEGGRGSRVGRERHRARNTLVIVQMAMALVLLVGSGLMVRSFQALRSVDPGFANPEEVLTFRVSFPAAEIEGPLTFNLDGTFDGDIGDAAALDVAYEDMWRRIQEIPGVRAVGAASNLTMGALAEAQGISADSADGPPVGRTKFVTEGYFEAMQIPILAGRPIEWSDIHDRATVAVVTANFAEEHWGDLAAAVGELYQGRKIIGVVGNVHDDGVSQPPPQVRYQPMAFAGFGGVPNFRRSMSFAVRTSRGTATSLLPEVRAAISAVDPNLPLAEVRTLNDILAQSMARTSFTLVMLAIAAAVALGLGLVGIYGVISYIVSQRTREIGVRMALGADRRDVRRMVLRQGVILAGVGVAVGLVAAVGLTRLMSSLLYGVEATDPVTFGVVAALLTTVALVASYLPALRASRTDPLEALRFE